MVEVNCLKAELEVQCGFSKLAASVKAEKALTEDKVKLQADKQWLGTLYYFHVLLISLTSYLQT
jgi:hypothetical protein